MDIILRRRRRFDNTFPLSISNLTIWLDSSDDSTLYQDTSGTTPATNGDVVGLWQDKSGNSRDFTQSTTANKPVLSASGLVFDGVDDFLQIASLSLATGNRTVFFAINPTTAGGASLEYLLDATSSRFILAHVGGDASNNVGFFDGAWKGFSTPAAGNQLYTYVFTGTSAELFIDTVSQGTATYTATSSTAQAAIGSTNDGASFYFTNEIKEILIYESALSGGDRARVAGYLNRKWGLY